MSRENECPYCGSDENCMHLMLVVDLTFRDAGGGALYEAFNRAWNKILNYYEDVDFDEKVEFDKLLEVVDNVSETHFFEEMESGPGMTSEYVYYFCSSKKLVNEAIKKFKAKTS